MAVMDEPHRNFHSPWHCDILTLYPDMFPGSLGHALAGKALEKNIWSYQAYNIRDFAEDKHRSVDDTPAGGGAGMVLRADILGKALSSISTSGPKLLMSPRGKPLTQERVKELINENGCLILCGRFEGVDQRVIDYFELEEISIGDYVLSGGEIAALTLMDACIRLLPDVMGKIKSGEEESFENNLLEYPHYTRPNEWQGLKIPEVLTSGNHHLIDNWRKEQAEKITKARRPELFEKYKNIKQKP